MNSFYQILFAQEPAPSKTPGMDTLDLADNAADDNYQAEGGDNLFDDLGGDAPTEGGENLFDDMGGGADPGMAGGGGGMFDMPGEEGGEGEQAQEEEEKEPYEVEFVRLNFPTYQQLVDDSISLIEERSIRESDAGTDEKIVQLKELLLGIGWAEETLENLSFNNPKNIDLFLEKIIKNEKNFSSEIDILDTFPEL